MARAINPPDTWLATPALLFGTEVAAPELLADALASVVVLVALVLVAETLDEVFDTAVLEETLDALVVVVMEVVAAVVVGAAVVVVAMVVEVVGAAVVVAALVVVVVIPVEAPPLTPAIEKRGRKLYCPVASSMISTV